MFCNKCGKQLEDGVKFCTSCGAPVAAKADTAPATVDDVEEVKADSTVDEPAAHATEEVESAVTEVEDLATKDAQDAEVPEADAADTASEDHSSNDDKQPTKKKGKGLIIGICSAAVVIVAAVAAFIIFDPFNPNLIIDADAFPNDVIRGAVLEQLDTDGDGRLSDEEAAQVTALVYTPDGAEFVTEGDEVDVQAIREQIKQKAAEKAETASAGDEGAGKQPASSGNPVEAASVDDGSAEDAAAEGADGESYTLGSDMAPFINMKTLVATDSDLKAIDLSELPQLEYADVRNNPDLKEFDLAANPNIKVLFCAENTAITGLEDAGLYYTDLVTGMQVAQSDRNDAFVVEYDTHARPSKVTDSHYAYTYTYDDAGRLAHVQQFDGDGKEGWYENYAYGNNGLLSNASAHWSLDVSAKVNEFAFGYDAEGRLAQFASGESEKGSEAKTFNQAGSFEYADGKLASYKGTNAATLFAIGDNDMLTTACRQSDSETQVVVNCAYAPSGAMSDYTYSSASLNGSLRSVSYSTEYDDAGFPVKSAAKNEWSSTVTSYECNADGYISSIKWDTSELLMSGGATGNISYVKRVGSLADRESERFVPVIRPQISERGSFYADDAWFPLQNWYSSTAFELPITIIVESPLSVIHEQLGLRSNMLCCPHEISLAAYDREHWAEGLSLGEAQPINEPGVSDLLAKAAGAVLPIPARAFLDDAVYGGLVKEYLDAAKHVPGSRDMSDTSKEYPNIPSNVLSVLVISGSYGGNGASDVVDFSYIDLNGDGKNELAVTFPEYYRSPSSNTGTSNEIDVMAVYGESDGVPVLIAHGGDRQQCWVTPHGEVATFSSGGAATGIYSIYAWDGSQAIKSGELSYDIVGRGTSLYEVTVTSRDGSKSTSRMSSHEFWDFADEFTAKYEYAQLRWVPVATSQ